MILGALASTKHASADPESPCRVRLASSPASTAWSSARSRVEERVATLTSASTDCRLIVVTPEQEGASVEFTTADHRVARRHIVGPEDLLPIVEALLVFGHDPMLIAPPPPPPPPPAETVLAMPEAPAAGIDDEPALYATRGATIADPVSRDQAARTKPDAPRVLVGAGAGVKHSWPNDSLTGVGQFFAGMTLAHWEVAAFGRLELEHDADDDRTVTATAGKLRYSATGGGAMAGRREHVGPLLLVGGARAAVYGAELERVATKTPNAVRPAARRDEFLDPRLGLYAGVIATESSRLRVRVEVDGDMGVVVHRAELADLGAFPRWTLGISLGAEAGFLP